MVGVEAVSDEFSGSDGTGGDGGVSGRDAGELGHFVGGRREAARMPLTTIARGVAGGHGELEGHRGLVAAADGDEGLGHRSAIAQAPEVPSAGMTAAGWMPIERPRTRCVR